MSGPAYELLKTMSNDLQAQTTANTQALEALVRSMETLKTELTTKIDTLSALVTDLAASHTGATVMESAEPVKKSSPGVAVSSTTSKGKTQCGTGGAYIRIMLENGTFNPERYGLKADYDRLKGEGKSDKDIAGALFKIVGTEGKKVLNADRNTYNNTADPAPLTADK
jgi:hypothetical protein